MKQVYSGTTERNPNAVLDEVVSRINSDEKET
jgi:hypothetical protein